MPGQGSRPELYNLSPKQRAKAKRAQCANYEPAARAAASEKQCIGGELERNQRDRYQPGDTPAKRRKAK